MFFVICILVLSVLAYVKVTNNNASKSEQIKKTEATVLPIASATATPTAKPSIKPTATPTAKPTAKPIPAATTARATSVPANAKLITTVKIALRKEPGTTNAGVAAKIVNGYVLKAGEIFSYNGVVGERTTEKGFVVGTMPITDANGNEVEIRTVGSGVCRLSVGLATAAKEAGLKQIEITRHTYEPWYFKANPESNLVDATVLWPNTDNKFKNTKTYDILIKCDVTNYVLHVNFYELT